MRAPARPVALDGHPTKGLPITTALPDLPTVAYGVPGVPHPQSGYPHLAEAERFAPDVGDRLRT